jgi:purine nucleosidase
MKVIVDTDIGGDIDDAVALGYLLRQPRCELLGITTVGGEPEVRATLASAVCLASGRPDVPIHVGAGQPLLAPERQPHAYQSAALGERWPHRTFGSENTAIGFLRDTIRAHPGEVTLLTIGPLTNVGLLFALDPALPQLLGGLMVMGGAFDASERDHEWNIVCDPHAAARVFAAPIALTSVGFDVTTHCRLDAEACRRRFVRAGGPFDFVLAMAEVYFAAEQPEIVFHDPLAAALVFDPSLCITAERRIGVELLDERRFGRTGPVEPAGLPPHRVAHSVDADAFFAHLFDVIGG